MLVAMGFWGGESASRSQLIRVPLTFSLLVSRLLYTDLISTEISYAGSHGVVGGKSASLSWLSVPLTTSPLVSSLLFTDLRST